MSFTTNAHLDDETEVVSHKGDDLRYTSLSLEILGQGDVTIFFRSERGDMVRIIDDIVRELTIMREQHVAWGRRGPGPEPARGQGEVR